MWKISDKRADTDPGGELAGLILFSSGFLFSWNYGGIESRAWDAMKLLDKTGCNEKHFVAKASVSWQRLLTSQEKC